MDCGQTNTVSISKINFQEPDIKENLVITQKCLKKCIIDHAKYINGEKIKENVFKDEEPIIRNDEEP